MTPGFLYAIREAIVNDLVEYDLNGSDYVSCIVSEEYKDTAKYFIFIDIFILFLIPLIIIVSNYARVRECFTGFNTQSKVPRIILHNINTKLKKKPCFRDTI